jgi:hypothetical protein
MTPSLIKNLPNLRYIHHVMVMASDLGASVGAKRAPTYGR